RRAARGVDSAGPKLTRLTLWLHDRLAMSKLNGRIGGLVVLLIWASCGGGDSGAGGQACTAYATAFCKRIYACTPAAMQDADFHTSYGSSEAQCVQQESQLCNT